MKVVWIIDAEHWPRALLRAELIERGYDAAGFVTVDDAERAIPARWPDAIVIELRTVSRNEAERLMGTSVPVIAIAGAAPEPFAIHAVVPPAVERERNSRPPPGFTLSRTCAAVAPSPLRIITPALA